MHTRFCLCPLKAESLFPPVLCKSYNQIPLAFKVRFPGDSHSLLDPQAGKPVMGLRTFTTVRELLQCYCFLVCWLPTQRVWDWILSQLCSSYYLTVTSSLSLDVGYLFLVGFNILLLMAVQEFKTVVILVLLQEEISTHPSIPPS